MNKYRNIRGRGFDSRKEQRRYNELLLLQRAGKIRGLERQKAFTVVPAQYIDGKCVFRAVKYVADFVYYEGDLYVVEDVKSEATRKNREYVIKKKLMLWTQGILIRET